jgi:hypothetical protein
MVKTGAQSYCSQAEGSLGSLSSSKAGDKRCTKAVEMMIPEPKYSVEFNLSQLAPSGCVGEETSDALQKSKKAGAYESFSLLLL